MYPNQKNFTISTAGVIHFRKSGNIKTERSIKHFTDKTYHRYEQENHPHRPARPHHRDNAGALTERTLMSDYIHLVFTDSIETVDFMAVPYGNDSLRVNCFHIEGDGGRVRLFADTLKSDWRKILLETLTPGNGPDYPIMAYSSGIPIPGGAYWFCGLRESGTEPRLWYEKHGIKDYVYYTVTLEDDTPVSEKDDFYVKVSKGDYYGLHR